MGTMEVPPPEEKPQFTGKYKTGDRIRIKEKPGWKDDFAGGYRFGGLEGTIKGTSKEPGEDYQTYRVAIPKMGNRIVGFAEDELEEIGG